jgi:hypothetical protein
MCFFNQHLATGLIVPKCIGNMIHCHQVLSLLLRSESIASNLPFACICHRNYFDRCSFFFSQHLPRDNVAVMLHHVKAKFHPRHWIFFLPQVCATRLIESVVPEVKMISAVSLALMNARIFSRVFSNMYCCLMGQSDGLHDGYWHWSFGNNDQAIQSRILVSVLSLHCLNKPMVFHSPIDEGQGIFF